MRNQPCGLEVIDCWIEGTNPRKNQGIYRFEIFWTANRNCCFSKPFNGFPNGVEIAHAVIDDTEI
jgi:hypothetical protein